MPTKVFSTKGQDLSFILVKTNETPREKRRKRVETLFN